MPRGKVKKKTEKETIEESMMKNPHLYRINVIRQVVFDVMHKTREQNEKKSAKKIVKEVKEILEDKTDKVESVDVMQFMAEWRRTFDPRPQPDLITKMMEEAPRPQLNNFEYKLSPELAKILGKDVLSGNVIIKKIMGIIYTEKLRHPKNYSLFIPNEKLRPVFKKGPFEVKRIRMLLDDHLTPLW